MRIQKLLLLLTIFSCVTISSYAINFAGNYTIKTPQNTIVLTLKQTPQNRITGSLSSTTGATFSISGKADEDVAIGQCIQGNTNVSFESHFEDNFLIFTLIGNSPNDSKVIKFPISQKPSNSKTNAANNVFNMLISNATKRNVNKTTNLFEPAKKRKKSTTSSKSLLGNWICRTRNGNMSLSFDSNSNLTFNGSPARYRLSSNNIVVSTEGETLSYPYCFQNNALLITFPNGVKAYFTKITNGSSSQNGQHFSQLIGKWKDIRSSGNTIIELYANGQYSYYSDYAASNGSPDQTNWGYTNSNEARGTWKARGTPRQGIIYYQSQDGRRDTLTYQVHVEKGRTYWGEYIFDGTIYCKQ